MSKKGSKAAAAAAASADDEFDSIADFLDAPAAAAKPSKKSKATPAKAATADDDGDFDLDAAAVAVPSSKKAAAAAAAASTKKAKTKKPAAPADDFMDMEMDLGDLMHAGEPPAKASKAKVAKPSKRKQYEEEDKPEDPEFHPGDSLEEDDARVPEDEEEEEEEEEEAPKPKKKQKKKATPSSSPPAAAASSAAAAAAPSPLSKQEQLRLLLASMSEEEKKDIKVAIPAAAAAGPSHVSEPDDKPAAAASSTAVAVVPAKPAIVCALATEEEYSGPELSFMDMFNRSVDTMSKNVRFGRVRCVHPDQAMVMYLRSTDNRIHLLDFQKDEDIKQINVKRDEEKKPPSRDSKDRQWKGTGTFYVNLWAKFNQRWNGKRERGIIFMTPFGSGAFGRVGPTVDTGIEGDRGRVFDGAAKNDSESSVGIAISNTAYSHLCKDNKTFTNPTMDVACSVMRKITRHIAITTFLIPNSLPGWRAYHNDELEDLNRKEQFALLIKSKGFKGKVDYVEADKMDTIKASAACLRKLRSTWINGHKIDEDISDYVPPSELYEKIKMDDKGNLLIHNKIDVFYCNRTEDLDPAKLPTSNCTKIPFANAVINAYTDVFAIVYRVGVYEWKQKTCDVTHKIVAIIWLNTKEALEGMEASSIIPCDPRYSVPMAGKYKGPLDIQALLPAGVSDGNGGVSFVAAGSAEEQATIAKAAAVAAEFDPEDFKD